MHAAARKQRGLALLVVVLIALGLLAGMLAIGFAGDLIRQNQRQQRATDALAQAKEALIGWSVQRTSSIALPNARPGELPCPDSNNDGFEDGTCVAGALGRVPWKTLGIPEPKDSSGETLWYAIAGPFRIWSMNSTPINSDTLGNISVYSRNSSTLLTTQAVAVVFAPDASLGAQDRSCTVGVNCTAVGQCTTSPASLTPKCNPTNYLEATGGVNNATPSSNPSPPSFIQAQSSGTFNDRVLAITNAELMTPIERRVATEILALLQAYRSSIGCNCYPWADLWNGASNDGETRGRVPLDDADPDWSDAGVTIPAWMTNNDWWQVFYYAIAPMESEDHDSGWLTVDGVSGNKLVLITTGPASASRFNNDIWSAYLEDSQNSDNDDNTLVTPASTAHARDRIYVIP